MSSHQKNKIIDAIKNLGADDLGAIIEFIMDKCPKACHDMEDSKLSIVLSHFEPWLYR